MKNKVYAKQINCYDNSVYMDDDGIFNNTLFIVKKEYDRFYGFNADVIKYLYENIVNYSNYEVEVYYKNNLASYIIDALKSYKKISLKQALYIADILRKVNAIDTIIACLESIFNKKYDSIVIRGCCQGDVATLFYQKENYNFKMVEYIEAVYFNTGMEIMIHDGDDEIDDPNKIDGYCFYTSSWHIADIKQEIASQCACDIKDVVLYTIKDTITIQKDIYEAQ